MSEKARKVVHLYRRLSEEEKEAFHRQIEGDCPQCARLREILLESTRKHKEARRKRDSHPRNTDRDAEIVRLRDVLGLTFGQIAKRLGMTPDAVAKAYHRFERKRPPTN